MVPPHVKDFFEKSSDEILGKTAMKLQRSNHTVISGSHFCSCIITTMKRTITLSRELSDDSFGKIIIYWKFPHLVRKKSHPQNNSDNLKLPYSIDFETLRLLLIHCPDYSVSSISLIPSFVFPATSAQV